VERAFDDTLSNESSSAEQKIQATSSAADLAVQDILNTPADKETYQRSQAYFERLGSLVASLPGGLEEILARPYAPESHDHLSHSLRVAALSVALATRLGLVSNEKDRTALVTACYLHDAALEAGGVARAQLHFEGANRDRVAEWKTHPMAGAQLFQGKDFVNSRVLDLIAQHEETPNGDGFPQGLTKKTMDPLAIVLSLVNRFEDYLERYGGKSGLAIDEFFKSELGRYELEHLTQLKAIVLQASPSRA
jgi:HD-GYP domain-containing protein (c-di-GMP phosphodiesterase class II)